MTEVRDAARRLRGMTLGFGALALAGAGLLVARSPQTPSELWLIFMMGSLALLAELWPVSIFQRGVRITFTLPYLVGMAAVAGPVAALGVDILVSIIAALSLRFVSKQRIDIQWVILNVSIAAMSCSVAGWVWIGLRHAVAPGAPMMLLPVLGFVLAYSIANFGLVTLVDRWMNGPESRESLLNSVKPGVQAVGLYFLVSILVAMLVKMGYPSMVALTIIPIASLRYALIARARLYNQYYDTISALALMLQRAHPYTFGHLKRVSSVAEEVALQLGLSPKRARLVREAAVLHDIGKIAVDERVLDKPSRLTDEEFEHVKQHAAFGAEILEPVEDFRPMVPWIRHHHERPDGTGYPDQLTDVEIPIESKIIAVVDAYDAMTGGPGEGEKRSYREPKTSAEALAELERCAGSQFDPRVVAMFKRVVTGAAR